MHESLLRHALVFLVALGVCACDDPGAPFAPGGGGTRPPPIGTGGTGGSGAAGGDGGAGGVAGSAGAAGMGGSSGTGGSAGTGGDAGAGGASGAGGIGSQGACDNLNDRMILADLEPDPSEARRISAFCGVPACSGVDEATCVERVTPCIENRISGLSAECTACYAQLAACAGDTCNAECDLDPCGDCLTCGGGNYAGCQEDLGDCAGFVPPECSPT